MENELVNLSLDDGEEDVLLVPNESGSQSVGANFSLVWCFLKASIVHFSALKNTMANVWHPVRVQISKLGDKRFLFREDPVKVPLVFANFCIHVHELPMGLFLKTVVRQLGDCIGKLLEYDSKSLSKGVRNFLRIRVWLDVTKPLKQKKKIMHNDSYQITMSKGKDLIELDWDLSLRAQSRRVVAMHSIWLIEEGDGGLKVTFGLNLEGVNRSEMQCVGQIDMEHNANETPIKGGDGKKRSRNESENLIVSRVEDSVVSREESLVGRAHFISAIAGSKPTGRNENFVLKCPWFEESTGN
ncbi:hypothetical protein CXB51_007833 [Gossypium anomalum]|uniref:DUF4283 domain-containing protein n=1 Tax=Gossypium anomalum TaxID=47600 RepID=A0A8J5ZCN1_9ROSI|nr:hypothetical protein CXB51_007833 [Gossypium anomalum]